jgi:hypothetical protein
MRKMASSGAARRTRRHVDVESRWKNLNVASITPVAKSAPGAACSISREVSVVRRRRGRGCMGATMNWRFAKTKGGPFPKMPAGSQCSPAREKGVNNPLTANRLVRPGGCMNKKTKPNIGTPCDVIGDIHGWRGSRVKAGASGKREAPPGKESKRGGGGNRTRE